MQHECFFSDLTEHDAITFNSIEECEEVMLSLGVEQRMRQTGKGIFRSDMLSRTFGEAEIFSDRFSTALTMYLKPPEGSVRLLLPRSSNGHFIACGENITNSLLILPDGCGADIIGSECIGSEAITLPQARFDELFEHLMPGIAPPDEMCVVQENTLKFNALQDMILSLAVIPILEPTPEFMTNLIAEMVACLGDSSTEWKPIRMTKRRQIAKRTQDYIEARYRYAVSMEDLCRHNGEGVRTIQRNFRDYFDLTISDYLKIIRLNAAYRDLVKWRNSGKMVTEIAMDNGFTHIGRFSVEFHRRFGITPSCVLVG